MAEAPLTLAYERIGPQDKAAVVLLHGFMGSRRDWKPVAEKLSGAWQCVLPDLPGHGDSGSLNADRPWTMEATALAVFNLLDTLGISRSVPLGYSMGGRLALFMALRFSSRCAGAIIESASPGLRHRKERQERRSHDNAVARRLESQPFESFLAGWYGSPLFDTLRRHPAFPGILAERVRSNPSVKALVRSLREMGTGEQPSLWDELPANKLPLLLIVGEKDAKFRAICEEMAQLNPLVMPKVVDGCGHNVHTEAPHRFLTLLDRELPRLFSQPSGGPLTA